MPFTPSENIAQEDIGSVVVASPNDKIDPSFLDVMGASFRAENIIGSSFSSQSAALGPDVRETIEHGYNVFDDIEGYEQYEEQFLQSFNRQNTAAIKADIDRENSDRAIRDASGWSYLTDAAASVFDPTILLPGGAIIKTGRIGASVGLSALSVGLAAGAGVSVQEAVLQGTQQTRTGLESGLNIGASVFLGGAIGGVAAKVISGRDWNKFSKALTLELQDADTPSVPDLVETITKRMQSGGSAAVDKVDLSDLGVGGKAAGAVARATAAMKINPGLELLTSPAASTRKLYAEMMDNPVYTKMEMDGNTLGPSTENVLKQAQRGKLGQFEAVRKREYRLARKEGYSKGQSEFDREVGIAAGRNDESENPHISAAAKAWRVLSDDGLKAAQGAGLLPDDVKVSTQASYVSRLWNRIKLVAQEWQFRDKVRPWLDGELKRAEFTQTEIGIGNKIVDFDKADAKLRAANDRLTSIENQIAERKGVRTGKVQTLKKMQEDRFDVMRDRAPKALVDRLRGMGGDSGIIEAVREVRKAENARPPKFHEKYPVLAILKEKGGVRVGTELDGELRAMGVTPKTFPGLFKKNGGLKDVDNFTGNEEDVFRDSNLGGADGYVDRQAVLDAIDSEMRGLPLLTADRYDAQSTIENLDKVASEWLESVGLPQNATVKQVREFINKVVGTEKNLDAVDARIAKFESEIEEFDTATDKLLDDGLISESELAGIADDVDALEKEILAVSDIAKSSPKVSLIVDYAKAKRDLFKQKMSNQFLEKRIAALNRLDKEGKATDRIRAELAAKEIDLSRGNAKLAKLIEKADKLEPMQPKVKQELPDFINDADKADYLEEIMTDIFNNLTGRGSGSVPEWIVPAKRGPLKERTFNIPDNLIEEWLDRDIQKIAHNYVRKVYADVELTNRFGSADMAEKIAEVRMEYTDLRASAKTEKERIDLDTRERRDVQLVEAFRDQLRGTYRTAENGSDWAKISRAALTFNYIRLLGGVAITSLTDVARPIGVHGIRAAMTEGYPALVSGIRAVQISKSDAKELGAVTERLLHSRVATLADLQDPYAYGSKYERFLANSSTIFSTMTGLGHWNDALKTVSSILTQNRMIRNSLVGDYSKLDPYEKAYMGYLGISEGSAAAIAAQFKKHGFKEGTTYAANVAEWDDDFAKRIYAAALNKDVDRTIVTKGIADTPLWMKTNTGRLIFQFKSFMLASHQRVLIAGLQERPHRLAENMVLGTAIGMLTAYLKMMERDPEKADQLLDNPGKWIASGFDYTGIMSLAFEVSNTTDKISGAYGGPNVGISALASAIAGDPDRSGGLTRYASRNASGAVLGPSVGALEDIANVTAGLMKGDLNKSQANSIVGLVPGGSLPGVRTVINQAIRPALQDAVSD